MSTKRTRDLCTGKLKKPQVLILDMTSSPSQRQGVNSASRLCGSLPKADSLLEQHIMRETNRLARSTWYRLRINPQLI